MIRHYQLLRTAIAPRLWTLGAAVRADDRGEINSSVAWTGIALLIAVGVGGIVSGKAEAFAESLNFGP